MRTFSYALMGVVITGLAGTARCESAVAVLKAYDTNGPKATVKFKQRPEGLLIEGRIENATPGIHALHIHEFGSCEDKARVSGEDYNPTGRSYKETLNAGTAHERTGSLGNVQIDSHGSGEFSRMYKGLSLSAGKSAIAGRSILFFGQGDDFSRSGNAGEAMACGTILMTQFRNGQVVEQ